MSSSERGVKLVPIVEEGAGLLHSDDDSENSSFLFEDPVEVILERNQIEIRLIKPMTLSKVGGPRFEVEHFDGRTDYFLWERQVKTVIKAMDLENVLKPKTLNVDDKDWNEIQDQALCIMTLYLKPNVLKQVEELETVKAMFQAVQTKYNMKELSNSLFTLFKLMSFKMVKASYHILSSVLLHRDKESITYNKVVTPLLTDNIQQKQVSSSTPSLLLRLSMSVVGDWRSYSLASASRKIGPNEGKYKKEIKCLEVWQAEPHEKGLAYQAEGEDKGIRWYLRKFCDQQ
ncbi:hypothetical protein AXG93_2587s1530 [Marchantia polymorpha subsp. ruderalis]|uniref:Uncharacterized protein n=1 Tax=Marchantia polymorpha subsp. ruderalis TaxID=1480154 RepID=A0A176WQN2_MARPO|nr:hypothetical protein AXG93_2587s1530 [Marchantia polymorpha subsp. ruderalis]